MLDEKDAKLKEKIPAERNLVLWSKDIYSDSEPEEIPNVTKSFQQIDLDTEGKVVVVGHEDCSFSYNEDGGLDTILNAGAGPLMYFKNDKGNFQRIAKVKIPQDVLKGAIGIHPGQQPQPNRKAIRYEKEERQKESKCAHCGKKGHVVYLCNSFLKLSLKEKLASVKDNKLCFRCLNPGHLARDCRVRFVCDIDKCGKRHHRLLHADNPKKSYMQMLMKHGIESDEYESESDQ
jgi:hypothetical protein